MAEDSPATIVDNRPKSRFELQTAAGLALADYKLADNIIRFTHTEVPVSLRGAGWGAKLIRFALDESRKNGYRVVPQCSFVAHFIQQHAEYSDLLK